MSTQPEALRLADRLTLKDYYEFDAGLYCPQAAAELRRLHEEAEEQARLLGISAERELALLAKIDRMEKQLGEAVWNYGEKVRAKQDLLEALAWIANRCPVHLMDHPLHNIHKEMAHDAGARARYAIAKATGETK